ncbi:hypothetical protein Micbo1qcDRAFT_58857 [Microdochium bolleyi]|uniref:Solute carrier family 40 member n=1 Tax=Microdochium bolleyi TaxID=196109 RepID=A0A136J4S9_9PEZI|nr:hypothetical protein Micbo1qcDRAFT_58857 [Microdochium bolleyi]
MPPPQEPSPDNDLAQHVTSASAAAVWGADAIQSSREETDAMAFDDDDDNHDDDAAGDEHILLQPSSDGHSEQGHSGGLTRRQAWNLYLSHALSTWNARGYEFGAVLFTAAAYPGTLVAASARMIIIYFAMIVFSSSIGNWVDRSPSRLRTLLTTIVCNRGSVVVGSLFWMLILSQRDLLLGEDAGSHDAKNSDQDLFFSLPTNGTLKAIGFALAICCGIAERLSASGNLLSMERDWVPTVAARPSRANTATGPGNNDAVAGAYDLTHLNAVMRRIDLVCKLFSPIALSLVISLSGSTRAGVVFTALTSAACVPVEIVSARSVWSGSRALQEPKEHHVVAPQTTTTSQSVAPHPPPLSLRQRIIVQLRAYPRDVAMYLSSPSAVWLPSLALALLHFNMLTWRATFITYLLAVGYPLGTITAARTAGSLFEISSTVITPRLVVRLGRTASEGHGHGHRHRRSGGGGGHAGDDDGAGQGLLHSVEDGGASGDFEEEDIIDRQTLTGLQRVGLWGITWQVANTIPVVLAIWIITADLAPNPPASDSPTLTTTTTTTRSISNSVILFTFLSLSRLGVWVFDLTTQQLTQTLVPSRNRSSFAGVEASVTNIFELAGALASIAFPSPRQYPHLATASLAACALSWALYAGWVRRRRGHLVHLDRVVPGGDCLKMMKERGR